jgi:RNA recognition motif-containing protein
MFAQTGTVKVSLIEDRETGRSRGFGFIEMSTAAEGAAAIEIRGWEVGGRALKVKVGQAPRESLLSGS